MATTLLRKLVVAKLVTENKEKTKTRISPLPLTAALGMVHEAPIYTQLNLIFGILLLVLAAFYPYMTKHAPAWQRMSPRHRFHVMLSVQIFLILTAANSLVTAFMDGVSSVQAEHQITAWIQTFIFLDLGYMLLVTVFGHRWLGR